MENEKDILPEVQQIADAINAAVKNAGVTVSINPSPAEQHSLLLFPAKARECAQWLKAESPWQLDYLSNVSGNDWPEDAITKQTPKQPVKDAGEEPMHPCLEAVYHLYSISRSLGPVHPTHAHGKPHRQGGTTITYAHLGAVPNCRSGKYSTSTAYTLRATPIFDDYSCGMNLKIITCEEITSNPMTMTMSQHLMAMS